MKLNELRESSQPLDEVYMSPTELASRADRIPAKVGIEFEVCVPIDDDSEVEAEEDFSYDDSVGEYDWQNELRRFFTHDDYNDRSDVDKVINEIEEWWLEWISYQFERWLDSPEGLAQLKAYVKDELDLEPGDDVDEKIDYAIRYQTGEYQTARDELDGQFRNDVEWRDFLRHKGISTFSQVARRWHLVWPYWTKADGGEIHNVISDFEHTVGTRVLMWRGADNSNYGCMEDTSIKCHRDDYRGIELVSPPLGIDEMREDLNKFKEWADANECYTNETTGLHVNVSLNNFDVAKLDYVKLVLFVGDKYVLSKFGRLWNTYTESAFDKINARLKRQEETQDEYIENVLWHMQQQMVETASQLIHTAETAKYTSVNVKPNRIEFRSAGGDWLNRDLNTVVDTVHRYIYALYLAMDPSLRRKEYVKKLYKLLNAHNKSQDQILPFVLHSAGQLSAKELMAKLQTRRGHRLIDKIKQKKTS